MAEFIDIDCEINNGDKNMGQYLVVFDWFGERDDKNNTKVCGPTEKVNWHEALIHFVEREEIPLERPGAKAEVYELAVGLDGKSVKHEVLGQDGVYE